MSASLPPWLDQSQPYEQEQSAAQISSLLDLLGAQPRRVLDLGCGAGRVLVPLRRAGHDVIGIDRDGSALHACRAALDAANLDAKLVEGDFERGSWPSGPFDAVICLGNTFMTIADLDAAIALLRRAREALNEGGMFIIDDLPRDFWPDLSEGYWQEGLSDDGQGQLIWHPTDCVFTLRLGERVDIQQWELTEEDQLLRLWTSSALRMACELAGLSEPAAHTGLLVMGRRGEAHLS